MQLNVVIAFALLIWWPREQPFEPPIEAVSLAWTVILGQLVALWLLARLASSSALKTFHARPDGHLRAQHNHHRNQFLLRLAVLLTFVVDLAVTPWPRMIHSIEPLAWTPAVAELIILTPFLLGTVMVLIALFPIDRTIRGWAADAKIWQGAIPREVWDLRAYLSFNIRQQLLTVVVPMSFILFAYNVTRDNATAISRAIPLPFAPDILLGASAALIFLAAPWMLKRIWITSPLPQGPLRTSLENVSKRIGLKCQDILTWHSGGMVVNAAVMGLVRPVRYVMLSDALLDSMNQKQIEAVFGHEAGHVRHGHIQFFLLFAVASMLTVSGIMELLLQLSRGPDAWFQLSMTSIQIIGFAVILCLWGTVFGYISRRFERQADLFGARTVTPQSNDLCTIPCAVHPSQSALDKGENWGGRRAPNEPKLCATAAKIFADALDRVAVLNGIPREERSWRHSSIASRIEFLASLAGDLNRLQRFERTIRVIKYSLIVFCVVGLTFAAYYTWSQFSAAGAR